MHVCCVLCMGQVNSSVSMKTEKADQYRALLTTEKKKKTLQGTMFKYPTGIGHTGHMGCVFTQRLTSRRS